ncbi:UNVERIFIED_CONTAM: Retrovirus-related Pol polyprotein from type-2 retrotransposable element R2DM [Sesamum radiatum]|uniref:Retrovirus-related Pol polyprotein from type-2 retrotransposable element R2DM n=1 Tax=Sesamum radiatum TaxID=300843 RepID=A0AAW2J7A7_SESRA
MEIGVDVLRVEAQFIHCALFNKRTSTKCLISVVYGDCEAVRRRSLWESLLSISEDTVDDPWCVLGDFNAIVDPSESCGRVVEPNSAMAEFSDFITDAALVHLPFQGCPYTWHNCSEGIRSLWRRLDRVLVNEVWLLKWPRTSYLSALPSTSDHSPIVLRSDECRPTKGQKKKMGELSVNVCQARVLLDKAQALFEVFREDILNELVQWCRRIYCKAVELEASMLRQRAKLSWLKYGDQCTSIFFKKINARRAAQRVFQIYNSAGEMLTEQSLVAAEFVSYFQSMLGGVRRASSINCDFLQPHLKHILNTEEADALVRPITHEEIREAFYDISEDSAPGPDGYTSGFFKAAWSEIGDDICAAVAEFFISGRLLKQLNATMLVLIPKIHLPVRVSDFRPIACCNVLYKAITKILVRRMQQVLDLLIDYSQNAFVPGRSIADNILLAQELMAGYNQSRLPQRCTIKVDIQKAYDSVHWDFVLESLRIFNFPSRFISWIEQCLTTPTFSISLNGSVHGFFKGARGLRQGDPMSPYLFVLVMEIWHVLLTIRTRNEGSFQHHWKCNELGIVNLSFADDILIFCAGNLESVRMIKHTLAEFAEMSGLHVNPNKSTIILSKAVRSERRAILDLMGFPEAVLPIKYLGVPLIASRLTVADCQPLIDSSTTGLQVGAIFFCLSQVGFN